MKKAELGEWALEQQQPQPFLSMEDFGTYFSRMKKGDMVAWALKEQRRAAEVALFADASEEEQEDEQEEEPDVLALQLNSQTRILAHMNVISDLKKENDELKGELENLKVEMEDFQMCHPCEMECGNCCCTITEDDLELSLGCGELVCEGCYDEEGKVDLREQQLRDLVEKDKLKKEIESLKKEIEAVKIVSVRDDGTPCVVDQNDWDYLAPVATQKYAEELAEENKSFKMENKSFKMENKVFKMEIESLKKENQNFKDICTEYLDGTERTANPVCLSQAVEEWTDEIVQLREEVADYEDEIESLKKRCDYAGEFTWSDRKQELINEFMEKSESWSCYREWLREYHEEDASSDEED